MPTDINLYKEKLDAEVTRLEGELSTIARSDSEKGTWVAIDTAVDESTDADPNEVADKIEEFETNQAITASLKAKLFEVMDALSKIEKGTYGICEICSQSIEEDRLQAIPSARTCKTHMN
jgi:RNA polymerase-binding transcription factor DksA